MLAHSWSNNYSPHIRHAVYWRLCHVEFPQHRARMLTEPWVSSEGL
jgi:hypothetical protein